jgi:hypothetical protein
MRKTIPIVSMVDIANEMLAKSRINKEERQALCRYLTTVLMANGCYQGFRYLIDTEVPEGFEPGIDGNGTRLDETRIRFLK